VSKIDIQTAKRALTLATLLARSSEARRDYLDVLKNWGVSPLERGLPWIAFGAIHELERLVAVGTRVLEFGSGGSTLFFASLGASVTSVENDGAWADATSAAAKERSLQIDLRHLPTPLATIGQLTSSGFLNALDDAGPADVVLVDSFDARDYASRPIIARHAQTLLRPRGILILDDYQRYEASFPPPPGWAFRVFTGPGPQRRFVTSTAMFRCPAEP
jgi:hypothetical protein